MSQSSEPSVYKGPWVNWSHGRVLGCTITLSEGDGALLTAFLAVFVAAAGTACWKILSYTLHQCRAKHQPQDAFHHQLQVVFRNTGTAGGAVWQFLQLAWYWRKQSVGPFARILPVTLLALLNLVFFSLAAIFSSQVTKSAGDQVLIRSPRCGWLNSTLEPSSIQGSDTFGNLIINDTLTASTYSKACYGDSANPLQCNQYIRKSLPWETNQNASCPFLSSMCYYGATGAYSMDSGLLDSHSDIGINARESGRVQYRKVTTCSPIHFSSYVRDFNDTDPDHLAYGDRLFDIMLGGAPGITDYTLRYNMHTKVDNIGYAL